MAISTKITFLATATAIMAMLDCDQSSSSTATSPSSYADAGSTTAMNAPAAGAADGGHSGLAMDTRADASYSSLTDAQIVSIVQLFDKSEIDQADFAPARAKSDKVKSFARQLVKDHSQADNDFGDLEKKNSWTVVQSDARSDMERDSKSIASRLESRTGLDFDREYMNAQIREHQNLLDMIGSRLMPAAKDPDLQSLLKKTREKVADHLKMARDIDSSLSS